MKKYINGEYIEMTQAEIDEFNSGIDSSNKPTIEDRLAALESTHVTKILSNATLLADGWVGESGQYAQVVEIPGVTPYSKVDLQPSIEQLEIFHDKDLAFVAENDDGIVTVYVLGDKPANDYIMQVTITEVTV